MVNWTEVFKLALSRECSRVMFSREWPPEQRRIKGFIVYNVYDPPDVNLEDYALLFTGLVEQETRVSYLDILTKLPCVDLTADFHCVTGWSVSNVSWRGVKVRDIMPKPLSNAKYALVIGADGYTTNIPINALMEDTSIVAYAMNGSILSKDHGFPLRLVIPSRYGWKSAKYVKEVRLIDEVQLGYWESLGYHDNGDPWLEERFRNEEGSHRPRRGVKVEK
ncbi:molybdopterin-dependent oxidoreductase [Caldivirga sp.]|uniref:molybdopterin-dependent oxidoreductase n=1 Tax=Caldivirga sp. TaxID=2080243 RepID=UPI0025C4E2A0|nr:molybdopterin-dependent oxidoreductase [Caldivirga sp.]